MAVGFRSKLFPFVLLKFLINLICWVQTAIEVVKKNWTQYLVQKKSSVVSLFAFGVGFPIPPIVPPVTEPTKHRLSPLLGSLARNNGKTFTSYKSLSSFYAAQTGLWNRREYSLIIRVNIKISTELEKSASRERLFRDEWSKDFNEDPLLFFLPGLRRFFTRRDYEGLKGASILTDPVINRSAFVDDGKTDSNETLANYRRGTFN